MSRSIGQPVADLACVALTPVNSKETLETATGGSPIMHAGVELAENTFQHDDSGLSEQCTGILHLLVHFV